MTIEEQKAELNRQSEEDVRRYLRSLSWPEKVRSIERMNEAMKIAQKGMREALARERAAK